MTLDPVVALIGYGGLALMFAGAALHKLRDPVRMRAVLTAYDLLPPLLVPWVAGGLCLAEMALATGLIMRWPAAAMAAAGLLTLYTFAMAINLGRGRRLGDCGCGGRGTRLSWGLVTRNLALVGVCLALLIPSGGRALVLLDGFTVVCALTGLATMYGAVGHLAAAPGAGEEAR